MSCNSSTLCLLIAFACVSFSGCQTLQQCRHPSACDVGCDAGACNPVGGPSENCDDIGCDSLFTATGCDGIGGTNQIVRGRKIPLLDRVASTIGLANKIALWDLRADNHNVSPRTESAVVGYLQRNGLGQTLVRVNQYAPLDEWRRLTANTRIAAPWRYTFGTYDWLKYTLMPGRLIGGDWYNPFTDSVHLYSDIPAIGLAKAAYAKDVHSRTYPGTYASFQDAPLVGLYHEKLANAEVITYVKQQGDAQQLDEAQRILHPDFAGAVGAQTLGFLPYGNVYGRAAGALVGHAARGIKSRAVGLVMPN